jgi:hypothetical protein
MCRAAPGVLADNRASAAAKGAGVWRDREKDLEDAAEEAADLQEASPCRRWEEVAVGARDPPSRLVEDAAEDTAPRGEHCYSPYTVLQEACCWAHGVRIRKMRDQVRSRAHPFVHSVAGSCKAASDHLVLVAQGGAQTVGDLRRRQAAVGGHPSCCCTSCAVAGPSAGAAGMTWADLRRLPAGRRGAAAHFLLLMTPCSLEEAVEAVRDHLVAAAALMNLLLSSPSGTWNAEKRLSPSERGLVAMRLILLTAALMKSELLLLHCQWRRNLTWPLLLP